MALYLAKRLGQAVFILIGITLVTYVPDLPRSGRPCAPDRRPERHGGNRRKHPAANSASISPFGASTSSTWETCFKGIWEGPTFKKPR